MEEVEEVCGEIPAPKENRPWGSLVPNDVTNTGQYLQLN